MGLQLTQLRGRSADAERYGAATPLGGVAATPVQLIKIKYRGACTRSKVFGNEKEKISEHNLKGLSCCRFETSSFEFTISM